MIMKSICVKSGLVRWVAETLHVILHFIFGSI